MLFDKRKSERCPFHAEVKMCLLPDGPTFTVRTVDISQTGLGVMSSLALPDGQSVRLRFEFEDEILGQREIETLGYAEPVQVRSSRAILGGVRIGLKFAHALSREQEPVLHELWQRAVSEHLAGS